MLKHLGSLIRHDLLLTLRDASSWSTPLLFFVIIVCMFPLALGPDENLLTQLAPSIIWIAALLAIILSLGQLFKADEQGGYLDLYLLSPLPLSVILTCKVLSHWLSHCLPLILITPLLGLLLHLSFSAIGVLMLSLTLGTPILSLLGAVGAALLVGVKSGGLLLPVLIMPLYLPVLIFGSGAVIAFNQHENILVYFALIMAIGLVTLSFTPFLTGAALRIGVNQS